MNKAVGGGEEVGYKGITVAGFVSLAEEYADPFVFCNLNDKAFGTITAVVDDVPYARKRLVNPKTIYSGLFNALNFAEIPDIAKDKTTWPIQAALTGSEVLLASNVQLSQLAHLVSQVTTTLGVQRVVLGVKLGPSISTISYDTPLKDIPEIRAATTALSEAGIVYTIVLYEDTVQRSETALFPYRISSSHNSISSVLSTTGTEGSEAKEGKERQLVSSQDLARVLSEAVDLEKSYDMVYGLRAGGPLDEEILRYMRARGWSERIQVGMLLGDLMESIEQRALTYSQKEMITEDDQM
eukprot:gene25951-29315_t